MAQSLTNQPELGWGWVKTRLRMREIDGFPGVARRISPNRSTKLSFGEGWEADMTRNEPAAKSAALLGSIALLVLGGLASIVSVVAVLGLVVQNRFTWGTGNASFILLICGVAFAWFGWMAYRWSRK